MTKLTTTNILLRNGYVSTFIEAGKYTIASDASIGTVLMNLEYYGFALSTEVYRNLRAMSDSMLAQWWAEFEPELKAITGDDRNISDFVVYKNFPQEVLDKTQGEYWMSQILMYWGFPNEMFTQEVEPREDMNPSERKSTMLKLADLDTLQNILNSLLSSSARWKKTEEADVFFLTDDTEFELDVNFGIIPFKENLVALATKFITRGIDVNVKTGTDVLRLGAGLSDGDISLREKVRFKSFNRRTRKFLLKALNDCNNLEEDFARRKGVWKRFLHQLHPGDYKNTYPKVFEASDALYNDKVKTFNSAVEECIRSKSTKALDLLSTRPGEFSRRIVHMTDVYGQDAVEAFVKVLPKLSVSQIVSLRRIIDTSASRNSRVFPPKGSWAKLQIAEARPVKEKYASAISKAMGEILSKRVPTVKVLDVRTDDIKLPNNGSDEGEYARGTVFNIPDDVEFIRTASYWESKTFGNSWFDNGWNFFDENWVSLGECCWADDDFGNSAAIFSGDPTNSKEMKGRATQLIDLYPSKLLKQGVRYAVWNVLCFSHIKFADAENVFAALQWGIEPQKGNLFEPSRCQLSFELKGDYYTKYVCVIDLKTREMTYIDANLKANVSSASRNGQALSKTMPAFMEYINSLPTVYDLFKNSVDEVSGDGIVIYTDKDVLFEEEQTGYVFRQEGDNKYNELDLNKILSS